MNYFLAFKNTTTSENRQNQSVSDEQAVTSCSLVPRCVPRRGVYPVRQTGGGGGSGQKPERAEAAWSRRANHGEVCRQPQPGEEHAAHLSALPQPVQTLRGPLTPPGAEVQVPARAHLKGTLHQIHRLNLIILFSFMNVVFNSLENHITQKLTLLKSILSL